jgi:hypothetical protein
MTPIDSPEAARLSFVPPQDPTVRQLLASYVAVLESSYVEESSAHATHHSAISPKPSHSVPTVARSHRTTRRATT